MLIIFLLTGIAFTTLAQSKYLIPINTEKKTITQRLLMVQPNAVQFMREGDNMELSAKIVNLSEKEITGIATLELLNAVTNKPVDGWFKNIFPSQYFTVDTGQNQTVKFPIEIPFNFNSALTYRIKVVPKISSTELGIEGTYSYGEELTIPILTNRILATESMPLNLHGISSKQFKFKNLLESTSTGEDWGGTTHALTVEYTSNPSWYVAQALPCLMEYPYECVEQTFNRWYAITLATYISNTNPKIKAVFSKWLADSLKAPSPSDMARVGVEDLLSKLQKNEELRSLLLQETPWVLDTKNEIEQKKNIALLFDKSRMIAAKEKAFIKLKEMQSTKGGFSWFKGGMDDRYITQYITTGIGHLIKLNALDGDNYQTTKIIIDKVLHYLDKKIQEDYNKLIEHKIKLSGNNLSSIQIQYLYMRSFFIEYKVDAASLTAFNYYYAQANKYWLSNSKYMQAMIALTLHRNKDITTPKAIIKSLKENAINNEDLGMCWKEWSAKGGYYWHQSPIESQCMMIEAFMEIGKNNKTVDDLKTWLINQKKNKAWITTKATAEACYALLFGSNNWISKEDKVTIHLGSTVVKSEDGTIESSTDYFKKKYEADKVKADMGNITVSISHTLKQQIGSSIWGLIYWQYFKNLDKIITLKTPLKLVKKLFIVTHANGGSQLVALEDGVQLHVGDKIKTRIHLKVDRDMEYLHLKDMRAACMEPTHLLNEYKQQGDFEYFESNKDASTNLFFSGLARGSYFFEYDMIVKHKGNFNNGIATIQCMYAPEFTSFSEGIHVNVELKDDIFY